MRDILKKSFIFSIIIQIIIIVITFWGNIKEIKNKKLKISMILENVVQYIAFIFYNIILYSINKIENITIPRYIDWLITTPIMLISIILIMKNFEEENKDNEIKENKDNEIKENKENELKENKENEIKENKENKIKGKEENEIKEDGYKKVINFIIDEKNNIIKIILLNCLMLISGFLGEIGIINRFNSVLIGFVFFILLFNEIYKNYVKDIKSNINLFNFIIIVWSIYGLAALFNKINKNIIYNILDIISKNIFALFIFYKIIKK